MTGLSALPEGTLIERAVERLTAGPLGSATITRDILGIPAAPEPVAERLAVALLGADPRITRRWDGLWQVSLATRGSPRIEDCVFAVVDVETTGSRARRDRITEIAVVRADATGTETLCEALVNPGRPIPRAVTAVTGITDEMVRERPAFAEIADDVLRALSGRIFVAHNVRFDWRFVYHALQSARGVRLDGPRLCTVDLARRVVTGLRSRSLGSLAEYFGVTITGRHRAGGDARATAAVLGRLVELAREHGARTFDDLRTVDRRVRRRRHRRSASPEWMDGI